MNDDAALLRRFADEHAQADFGTLVRRHADLVYTVALRRLNGRADAALALTEDVFSELATTAASVSRRAIIVGWLYAAARRLPVGAEDTTGNVPAETSQRQIDDALDHLAEDDRSALLLHYFERRPLAEVGLALNLSATAAEISCRRAVEKLRARLAVQGQRLGSVALRAELENQFLTPLPGAAAERIIQQAVNAAALADVGGEQRTVRDALIAVLNSGFALGTMAAIAIAAALVWGYRNNSRLEGELTRLHGDAQVLASLQRDNRHLARLIAEAEQLRREVADLPAIRAVVRPNGPSPAIGAVSLTVTPEGGLRWENEDVTAEDLLQRLCAFHARYPSADTSILVRSAGAAMSDVMYVINESRKAGIRQVLVEGDPRADPGSHWL